METVSGVNKNETGRVRASCAAHIASLLRSSRPKDISSLRRIGIKYGFLSSTIRKLSWPLMLGTAFEGIKRKKKAEMQKFIQLMSSPAVTSGVPASSTPPSLLRHQSPSTPIPPLPSPEDGGHGVQSLQETHALNRFLGEACARTGSSVASSSSVASCSPPTSPGRKKWQTKMSHTVMDMQDALEQDARSEEELLSDDDGDSSPLSAASLSRSRTSSSSRPSSRHASPRRHMSSDDGSRLRSSPSASRTRLDVSPPLKFHSSSLILSPPGQSDASAHISPLPGLAPSSSPPPSTSAIREPPPPIAVPEWSAEVSTPGVSPEARERTSEKEEARDGEEDTDKDGEERKGGKGEKEEKEEERVEGEEGARGEEGRTPRSASLSPSLPLLRFPSSPSAAPGPPPPDPRRPRSISLPTAPPFRPTIPFGRLNPDLAPSTEPSSPSSPRSPRPPGSPLPRLPGSPFAKVVRTVSDTELALLAEQEAEEELDSEAEVSPLADAFRGGGSPTRGWRTGHGTARALLGSPKVVGVDGSGRVDLRKGSSRRLMAETGRSSRRLSLVGENEERSGADILAKLGAIAGLRLGDEGGKESHWHKQDSMKSVGSDAGFGRAPSHGSTGSTRSMHSAGFGRAPSHGSTGSTRSMPNFGRGGSGGSEDSGVPQHRSVAQVELDVNRALVNFDLDPKERVALLPKLSLIIHTVLAEDESLHYYQGFHDVCSIFLLVMHDVDAALGASRQVAQHYLREAMREKMEGPTQALHLLLEILRREDSLLYRTLYRDEMLPVFALPWLITWFSHSINDLAQVERLFDFLMCCHPLMVLYVATAIIRHHRSAVLQTGGEYTEIHSLFQALPGSLPLPALLHSAWQCFHRFPPWVAVASANLSREPAFQASSLWIAYPYKYQWRGIRDLRRVHGSTHHHLAIEWQPHRPKHHRLRWWLNMLRFTIRWLISAVATFTSLYLLLAYELIDPILAPSLAYR